MATRTSSPNGPAGLVAISQETARNNPDMVLGYVCWYTVPNQDIKLSKLRKEWLYAGLEPMRALDADPTEIDAFKRAVASLKGIERNDQAIDPNTGVRITTITETDVRLITDKGDTVQYQVSRVVRDVKGMEVNYPKALRIWLIKETGEVKYQMKGDVDFADASEIVEAFQARHSVTSSSVPGDKVRTMVRDYLQDVRDEQARIVGLSGENLRGKAGGVYFVLAKYLTELERLEKMLPTLWSGKDPKTGKTYARQAYLYKLPMANGQYERDMIRAAHIMNSEDDADEVIFDVGKLLRQDRERAVRKDVKDKAWRKLHRARARLLEYEEALGEEIGSARMKIEAMEKQLNKLPRS